MENLEKSWNLKNGYFLALKSPGGKNVFQKFWQSPGKNVFIPKVLGKSWKTNVIPPKIEKSRNFFLAQHFLKSPGKVLYSYVHLHN